jgi:putative MATE family efflux protein
MKVWHSRVFVLKGFYMKKQFFNYVLQSVIGMIGISVYILADTFFISIYSGADGLTMLNLILPVYGVMFAIGSMIGIGSATRFTIDKASGKDVSFYFLNSLFFSVAASIPFVLIGIFFPKQVLEIMGADMALAALGRDYVRIVMMAAPLFMMNYSFTAFVRNDRAPTVAMAAAVSGSMFNVVFDYVFIFVLKGGLAGAALATAISPVVTMLVCLTHLLSKKSGVVLNIKKAYVRPALKHFFYCIKLGTPAFIGEIANAVTTTVFNFLILGLTGNVGVAAYAIIANIALVAMSIFNGISQGIQPLISDNYGRSEMTEVKQVFRMGVVVSVTVMVLLFAGIWFNTASLINIFNNSDNQQLFNYTYQGMHLYFTGLIFGSVNIIMLTYFAATDRAKIAFIGSISRGVVMITLCAAVLSKLFGMTGIWVSFGVSEFLTFLIIILAKKDNGENVLEK